MPTSMILLVLLAALLHACWNAVVKSSPDKFLDIVLVTASAALISAVTLVFLPLPALASLPYVATSVLSHVVYFTMVGAVYRLGDMSHAYPIMRGAPPLIVALLSVPLLGEALSASEWAGVLLISGSILSLLVAARWRGNVSASSTILALLNAGVIVGYTLVDGTGVRLSGQPVAYTMWMYVLTGPLILAWALKYRRGRVLPHFRARWPLGLLGGACTLAAYILILFTMTRAPIAMVAALRESAIIFGTVISVLVLKERPGLSRTIAATTIMLGIVVIKLG
ncbi:MAG TPA: DMT family transporter [Acidocella sp.]|nr:DMT family transporter [Acidocella sp.]